VVRLAPFGAFVNLDEGVDGLVHISQISHKHVATAAEVLHIGDVISVLVTAIDTEAQRISLSKKLADEELGLYVPEENDEPTDEVEEVTQAEELPEVVEEVTQTEELPEVIEETEPAEAPATPDENE
jgi:ribosomal protein S1